MLVFECKLIRLKYINKYTLIKYFVAGNVDTKIKRREEKKLQDRKKKRMIETP